MISKYGLINHFEKINAYLSVILDEMPNGVQIKQDEDLLIYEKDGRIYRLDIFNLKKYVKIRIQGLIYLPNYELIAILNSYLGKYDIMLMSKDESGFFIVKDEDNYRVKVKKDTLLANGEFVKEERFVTYQDLDINEPNETILLTNDEASDEDINKDFFQMEEREI